MSVINLSLGYDVPSLPALDPLVKAVEAASRFGVIVVAAAGNNGPNPGTVGSPAVAPHAIAAAASNNSRMFAGFLQVPGGGPITALPSAGVNPFSPIAGPLVDVATVDPTGLACNLLPANSLNNAIALIERGTCNFEVKFDYAQAAGAVAAVIYDNVPNEALVLMGVGHAMLPAAMISNADGLNLKGLITSPPTATIQFYQPTYVNPESLATFSAAGPSLDNSIKPDLTAVGENFYTAAETIDSNGELYNPTGYLVTQGTSFSAPLVSGAAALLESATARAHRRSIPFSSHRYRGHGLCDARKRRAGAAIGRRIHERALRVECNCGGLAGLVKFWRGRCGEFQRGADHFERRRGGGYVSDFGRAARCGRASSAIFHHSSAARPRRFRFDPRRVHRQRHGAGAI